MKYTEYNEKKQHGTSDFPIEYYFVTHKHSQYVMPLHWHSEFEILRVVSGKFTIFLNNVEYEMSEGDFAIIECGTLHRGIPKDCVYECLVFDLNMLRSKSARIIDPYIIPFINHTSSVKSFYRSNDGILSTTISTLFSVIRNKSAYYELDILSLLFSCFSQFYRQGYVSSAAQSYYNLRHTRIITELLDWIDEHYTEQISLSDLAKISGFKEKYLCRIFKEYTSRTPIDYINRLRINSACRDLARTDSTITEIAFSNGFNDLSYFSKKFKAYMSISPREYLKKQNHISAKFGEAL